MDSIIDISRFFNENLRVMWWLALFLGSWTVLAEFYRLVHFIYAKLIRKRKNLQERYGKGKWAFITGSSEGKICYIKESVRHLPCHWRNKVST